MSLKLIVDISYVPLVVAQGVLVDIERSKSEF